MIPSNIVAVSSYRDERYLLSPSGLRADDYTLIRLSNIKDRSVLKTLDKTIEAVFKMSDIVELNGKL